MAKAVDKHEDNIQNGLGEDILEILLTDFSVTAYKNDGQMHHIFWATHDYEKKGDGYQFFDEISVGAITGEKSNVIVPRIMKDKALQKNRVKNKAEIFTPSWVCNVMNNNIDNKYFGRRDVFNEEVDDKKHWIMNPNTVEFPEGKSWKDYIKVREMEYCCGEAPFIVSRYDTTTGTPIPVRDRIGFLDRKLRVINENAGNKEEWLESAITSYQNTLANEWQGDSLLLARENLLFTFIDYYADKFKEKPPEESIKEIANIISWNVAQMDGLKFVVPCTCHDVKTTNALGEEILQPCPGCQKNDYHSHNGIPVLIKSWKTGEAVPFHLLANKNRK